MKQESTYSLTPRKVPRLLPAMLLSAVFLFATAGVGSAATEIRFYTDNAYFGISDSGLYASWWRYGPPNFMWHHGHHYPPKRHHHPPHFRGHHGHPGYHEWRPEQPMRRPSHPGYLGRPRNYRR